jgi:PAS domain S-box-containing protein
VFTRHVAAANASFMTPDPQIYLDRALGALETEQWRSLLDELPVPVYTTDADGLVTYWNRACVDFAGREPQLGSDRWCVTWRIYNTGGDLMPHDQCPMAQAIREQKPIRGAVAIAARPDGKRRAFTPYPTPLFDQAGKLTGAVNMLIDVTSEQGPALARQAERCRRLSQTTHDPFAARVLGDMAEAYEATASQLTC